MIAKILARNVNTTDDSLIVDLDEDISAERLLSGHASNEGQRSFKRWLEERAARKK